MFIFDFHFLDLNCKKTTFLNAKYRGFFWKKKKRATLFNSLNMYLDFSTEIILFLVPYNLEMKDWVQFLGSVFFEKTRQ